MKIKKKRIYKQMCVLYIKENYIVCEKENIEWKNQ